MKELFGLLKGFFQNGLDSVKVSLAHFDSR